MPEAKEVAPTVVPMPVVPIVVTPIPAAQSTTLSMNRNAAKWTAICATALTLVEVITQLLAEPSIAEMVSRWIPLQTVWAIVGAVAFLARANWMKRMETSTPIIGSVGEAQAKEKE